MTAAAFLLIVTKRELLEPRVILPSVAFGGLGVLLGLATPIDAYIVTLVYTIAVLAFGFVYFCAFPRPVPLARPHVRRDAEMLARARAPPSAR